MRFDSPRSMPASLAVVAALAATHPALARPLEPLAGTTFGGRVHADFTTVDDRVQGAKSAKSGSGLALKRLSLRVDHPFDDRWAIHLTTDFQYASATGANGPYIKKAYIQYAVGDAFVLRAGSSDLPWVPFAENAYGLRYVENTLVDRLKFGTSADWGVHAGGKVAGGAMEYAVAAVNGNGYRNPGRGKGVDFEGRLSYAPTAATVIGVGAYSGTLGKETENTGALHTAARVDFIAAYASGNNRLGVEYFQAKNWNNVVTATSDKADGWSAWGSLGLGSKGLTLFARYDDSEPGKTLDPTLRDTYYNIGIEFPAARGVKLATVYKHTDRTNDSRTVDLETNEFGVWGEFRF
jgi:hypothetical protein